MANVKFVRKDLEPFLKIYKLINDCLAGEIEVKKGKRTYLPQPNPTDTSDANQARYDAYLQRAVFYNVGSRTLQGLVGQIFSRDAVVEVPSLLEPLKADANGGGVSLEQSSKRACALSLAFGRCGLFVDYPTTEGVVSVAELETGNIRPTVNIYNPWDVINWRTISRGAEEVLSLVVLKEKYVYSDDGFETKESIQYRVLSLDEAGKYFVQIYRENEGVLVATEPVYPTYSDGSFLTEIPFIFIGSENNDTVIDKPPLYDLSSLNIAHYRNSADYEESSYRTGQPTPYFTGLTEEWVKNVLGGVVTLGAYGSIPLPEGATAGLLQSAANTMPFEAMGHKEQQMVALGAKLVETKTVQRTATEVGIESASENSTLTSSTNNVSAAYTWALEQSALFVGAPMEKIEFELNTDFSIASLTTEQRAAAVSEWQAGALTFEEMRNQLFKANVTTLEADDAKDQIEKEQSELQGFEDDNGEGEE